MYTNYCKEINVEVGERVGAILGEDKKVIKFLGYGVYAGDFIPEDAVGGLSNIVKKVGHTNPRIDLDNGSHVWGCECWWGPEDVVRTILDNNVRDGYTIKEVSIDKERDKCSKKGRRKRDARDSQI